MISVCDNKCKHPFQDDEYGRGVRVMNLTRKGSGNVYRCTVCGHEQNVR